MPEATPVFAGSIPENYQRYLVPLIFEDYARDLAARVSVPAGGAGLISNESGNPSLALPFVTWQCSVPCEAGISRAFLPFNGPSL